MLSHLFHLNDYRFNEVSDSHPCLHIKINQKFLKIQIHRPQPRPIKSESLGVGPGSVLFFSPLSDSNVHPSQGIKYFSSLPGDKEPQRPTITTESTLQRTNWESVFSTSTSSCLFSADNYEKDCVKS